MKEIKFLFDVDTKQLNCTKILDIRNVKMYTDGIKKYILFKLMNKFSQPIDSLDLMIIQYNKNEMVLKRQNVTINSQIFKKNKNVQIEDLIEVDISTQRIEIEIIKINFINLIYENGTIYPTSEISLKAPKEKDEVAVKQYKHNLKLASKTAGLITISVLILILLTFILVVIFDHTIFEGILDFTN